MYREWLMISIVKYRPQVRHRHQGPMVCRQWMAEACDWSILRVSGGSHGPGPDGQRGDTQLSIVRQGPEYGRTATG